mmetsp:Transcript_41726/g.49983  ORF Transcript_41726/g.49983 Transcript_41726/m.49983 type:complete len:915 (-) Transcript_41726:159-2903(-)
MKNTKNKIVGLVKVCFSIFLLFPPFLVSAQWYYEKPPLDSCDKYKWRLCEDVSDCEYDTWKDASFVESGAIGDIPDWEDESYDNFASFQCIAPTSIHETCTNKRCVPILLSGYSCRSESDCFDGATCSLETKMCVACDSTPHYADGACHQVKTDGHGGTPPFEEGESGCAGDHCRHVCSYDTQCFRVQHDSVFADLTATHNNLGPVSISSDDRADLIRPSNCGGTDSGRDSSGMRCAGAIHRLVTSKYSTPQILKDRNLDFVELSIKNHEWDNWVALNGNETLYNAVTQPDGVFVGYPIPDNAYKFSGIHVGKGAYAFGLSGWHWGKKALIQCDVRFTDSEPIHTEWGGMSPSKEVIRSTLLTRICARWSGFEGETTVTFIDNQGEVVEFNNVNMLCGDWGTSSTFGNTFPFGAECNLNGPNVVHVIPDEEQRYKMETSIRAAIQQGSVRGADVVRSSFHDAATYTVDPTQTRGGARGCLRFEHVHGNAANEGIAFSIDAIGKSLGCGGIWNGRFTQCPWSMADILQFSGAVSIDEMGGPKFSSRMSWGRPDDAYIFCQGEMQLRMPDADGGHKKGFNEVGPNGNGTGAVARLKIVFESTRRYFEDQVGLNKHEWVALLGAHTIGGVRGLVNPARNTRLNFDAQPNTFDNSYYKRLMVAMNSNLLSLCPMSRKLGPSHWLEPGDNWMPHHNDAWLVLLDTDVSLVFDNVTSKIISDYATNQTFFFELFWHTYVKLSELGFDNLFKLGTSTTLVPTTTSSLASPLPTYSPSSTLFPTSSPTRTHLPSASPTMKLFPTAYIHSIKASSDTFNEGKWRPKLSMKLYDSSGEVAKGIKVTIKSKITKSKGKKLKCKSNKKGVCKLNFPEIPNKKKSIKITLIKFIWKKGEYDNKSNVEYEGCIIFSSDCPSINIKKPK